MNKHKYIAIALGATLAVVPLISLAQIDSDAAALEARQAAEARKLERQDEQENRKPDVRNAALGMTQKGKMMATTSMMRPLKATSSPSWKLNRASSTAMQIHKDMQEVKREIKDARKLVRHDQFEKMRLNLIMQLEQALANLNQIRNRLADRIAKAEASGRNMTDAKAKLAIADQKITLAEAAVAALGSYVPPTATSTGTTTVTASSTTSASTTPTISLDKPRQIGASAIEAVKAARKALQEVIVAIAKNMGWKIGQDGRVATSTGTTTPPTGTTTPPTSTTTPPTSTTTPPTATTTATTTTP